MDEVRCPTDNKLLIGLSADFVGALSRPCGKCKATVTTAAQPFDGPKIRCTCRKWLAVGWVTTGTAYTDCRRHRRLIELSPTGAQDDWAPMGDGLSGPTLDELASAVEGRWAVFLRDQAQRRAELAVGLRFIVLSRDGFRCGYCGRGPKDGVTLEVDHVHPRSKGGTDALDNLVTACWDCNRGKSNKALAS